ncbi:MAG: MFS transporter [Clostridia bacterium]|nr:MFS transporter [Clostridia bacterium]NCC42690.1 MFS transporter [Clostridia bacterium]
MKTLTNSKIWLFAVGQFGWSLLSGIISNWLVYVYQPDSAENGLFIPQGLVILGIFTIIGAITALGRVFDAFTDPWIASCSDRCKSPKGRRIPFLKWASFPLAASTVLIFCAPLKGVSWLNALWLFVFVIGYYLSITAYCAPYNALISELGHTQKERLTISTAISLTFIVGTAVSMQAANIWNIFIGNGMERMSAIRLTFLIIAVVAFLCMLVPVFTIREKDYVDAKPSESTAGASLIKTFKNRDFRMFVASDVFYWIALTMFQTGLTFFVTSLLGLDEGVGGTLFVLMTALSLIFYLPINKLVPKFGKKKLVLFAFGMFSIVYLYTALMGDSLPIPTIVQGYLLAAVASLPMAIFGILPQAMVADVADADARESGENRAGMFFAARTFAFKLGQSIAMLIFTSLATIGKDPVSNVSDGSGYRVIAGVACGLCLLGGILLYFYDEIRINRVIEKK